MRFFPLKYIKQLLIILAFSLLGELLQALIPLPVPASVYGFVLLFTALCSGLLKPETISATAEFLIAVMPVFFVAPVVNLLSYYEVIAPRLVPICIIVVASTFLVFGVTGFVTQRLSGKGDPDND